MGLTDHWISNWGHSEHCASEQISEWAFLNTVPVGELGQLVNVLSIADKSYRLAFTE